MFQAPSGLCHASSCSPACASLKIICFTRRFIVASFPGPLREFRTASDKRAGPGNEASFIACDRSWGGVTPPCVQVSSGIRSVPL